MGKKLRETVTITDSDNTGRMEEYFEAWYDCPACEFNLIRRDFKFCPNCGREIKWENIESSPKPEIKVALFSFSCPICGTLVTRGTNYQDDQGFKLCMKCG